MEPPLPEDPAERVMHVVCLVLVNGQGDVLTVRRPQGKRMAGCWEFPGGKVEPGESREEALRREIREELHLELEGLEPLPSVMHRYDFATVHLIPYLGRATEPQFHLAEHDAFRWLSPADLLSVPWAPADLPILRQLQEGAIRTFLPARDGKS